MIKTIAALLSACARAWPIFSAGAILCVSALAEHEPYCVSAYEIAPMITACPDNQIFAEAADRCIEKFTEEVNAVSQNLGGNFVVNQNKSASAQDSKQRNNNVNLNQTADGLRMLIAHAKRVRRDLYDYTTTIILPGNPGMDMLMAYNIYDLLAEDYCYHDNRIRLDAHTNWINQKIAELELAQARAQDLNGATVNRIGNLDDATGKTAAAPQVKKTFGKGSAARFPAGKNPHPESTITGEIKNEKLEEK